MRAGVEKFIRALAEMFLDRVVVNVGHMHHPITRVASPMVLKSLLPSLRVRAQIFLCSIGEAAFQKLTGLFETRRWTDTCAKMVRHDVDPEPCALFILRETATFPRGRRDHVSLVVMGGTFSLRLHWRS